MNCPNCKIILPNDKSNSGIFACDQCAIIIINYMSIYKAFIINKKQYHIFWDIKRNMTMIQFSFDKYPRFKIPDVGYDITKEDVEKILLLK